MKHFFNKPRLSPISPAVLLAIAMTALPLPLFAQDVRTQALEQQLQQLEATLRAVRNELDQVKAESAREAQRFMKIEKKSSSIEERQVLEAQRVAKIEEAAGSVEKLPSNKNHMLFFRGGYARSNELRNGVSIQSGGAGGAGGQSDRNAWYIGAGFDFNLTNDVWGLLPRTSIESELMFEYKEFASRVAGNALPPPGAGVNVSQFTLTAAPKIKFFEGSRFRPWIIPAGLSIHVISPPSESIILIPGVMFGAGADYRIWKNFFVGIDGRYHLTSGRTDGVKVDGMTAGGYLGIGF